MLLAKTCLTSFLGVELFLFLQALQKDYACDYFISYVSCYYTDHGHYDNCHVVSNVDVGLTPTLANTSH